MRLINKSASQRDVAQRGIRLKHVLSGQLDPSPDDEGMGRVPECSPESARKMSFAALDERTQVCDQYSVSNMPVDMLEHLPGLPCQ
jgi:hypothetical protein